MHVTVEPDVDPAHHDGQWITTARVTVRMTDAEYQQMDGLRFEALPWIRFRLRLYKDQRGPGTWRYEVHDSQRGTDETPIVNSGARRRWDTALAAGLDALLHARQACRRAHSDPRPSQARVRFTSGHLSGQTGNKRGTHA